MAPNDHGSSPWTKAWRKISENRLNLICLGIVILYALLALLAKWSWIAAPWDLVIGPSYQPPSGESVAHWLGTDHLGRSVLYKVLQGSRVAMGVGLVTCFISIPVGVFLGAIAGYFGGWVDDVVVWLYTVLSSVPNIMLIMAIAYVAGGGLLGVYAALSVTAWVNLARIMRGEFIKHKNREYVIAAESVGAGHRARIFRHILPNTYNFVIIDFSIEFVSAIKSEVILSFLGLGVRGQPSWGVMIDDSKLELARGVWWQLAGASIAMLVIVLAFNLLGDALRDALDPKN